MKVKENPLVTDSDYSRINTLAAAATAVDGKDDPKAFFVWCVATDKFQSLTQTAEDQARQTLRQIRRPQSGSVKNLFEMVEARSRPNSTVIDFDADPSDYSGGDA